MIHFREFLYLSINPNTLNIYICGDLLDFYTFFKYKWEREMVKWLAYGPRKYATSYTSYIINGKRFPIKDIEKSTQNSSVLIEAMTMCRSSMKDVAQVANVVEYYRVLKDIILLDYYDFELLLFKCDWANVSNDIKVEEEGFIIINLHYGHNQFSRDLFILVSQTKQIFYSRVDKDSNWYVVLRALQRGFHDFDKYDEGNETTSTTLEIPSDIMNLDDIINKVSYVRGDCEGILV